jgi:heptosyltransferase-3
VTHLAAATGIPTFALYGPTNPLKWAPWPYGYAEDKTPFAKKGIQQVGNVVLIQSADECVPCHQEGCEQHRQSSSDCLETLNSAVIIDAIESMSIV